MKRFLWLDVETTGLDPREDLLLEVAAWMTASEDPLDLHPEGMKKWVIHHSGEELGAHLSPVTWRMHCANGLLPEVIESRTDRLKVDRALYDYINDCAPGASTSIHLAGNSVHFDLSFLKVWLNVHAAGRLSHRLLDVSSIKLAAEAVGCTFAKAAPAHRAGDDVLASIELYRTAMGLMKAGGIK